MPLLAQGEAFSFGFDAKCMGNLTERHLSDDCH